MKKIYTGPESNIVAVEGAREVTCGNSAGGGLNWSPDGGETKIPVIEGNPPEEGL